MFSGFSLLFLGFPSAFLLKPLKKKSPLYIFCPISYPNTSQVTKNTDLEKSQKTSTNIPNISQKYSKFIPTSFKKPAKQSTKHLLEISKSSQIGFKKLPKIFQKPSKKLLKHLPKILQKLCQRTNNTIPTTCHKNTKNVQKKIFQKYSKNQPTKNILKTSKDIFQKQQTPPKNVPRRFQK